MKTAIVIGGGIAGCSTAYALAQRGIAVTLIERHEKLAQEASGNPLAVLYPKISTKPDATSLLALQGIEFTLNLLNHLPNQHHFFKACGLIQLAFNARETARQQKLNEQKHAHIINAKVASEIAGIPLKTGGLYFKNAGWVKPQALCEALCRHALITKKVAANALHITKKADKWTVNHAFEADFVVICAANDIKQFSQCLSAKITAVRGQINEFEVHETSEKLQTIVCSDHFISPALAGWHAIGTTYQPNNLSAELSETDTQENLNALRKISPEIANNINSNSVTGRVAWRSQTRDYMPLAGQLLDEEMLRKNPPRYNANPESLPWLEGLYVNAGHGSKGMITAPISGELIADLICATPLKTKPELVSRLNPSRFLLKELGLKQLASSLY